MIAFLAIAILPVLLIALVTAPALTGVTTWKQAGRALCVSAFGVVLPVLGFAWSAIHVPDWKGGCRLGWVDCFHLGKLALSPLLLWGVCTLHVVEIGEIKTPIGAGVILGLMSGWVVSSVTLIHGIILIAGPSDPIYLLSTLGFALWTGRKLVQLLPGSRIALPGLLATLGGSVPFWIGSVAWSQRIYESLPNDPPSRCFVVTAASRGHACLVGPFCRLAHGDIKRTANSQLLVFWQLEALWRAWWPTGHVLFRRAYDLIGPIIAQRISSPWLADLTYLGLKPFELGARLILSLPVRHQLIRGTGA